MLDEFSCSSSEQTKWLKKYAAGSQSTKTFVVVAAGSERVVAYYAWRMAELRSSEIPNRLKKGEGKYPQPVALLARLGVDIRHEGNGIGAALFKEVIVKTLRASLDIGCRGLLIHAETESAVAFYRHLLPGIEQSPTDSKHLVILAKDIKKTLS